jgi:SDR family mycofactocin-dependent oxidoreductase
MGQLDGQVALVTGGARGQGRSHALALAAEGAFVAICDVAEQLSTVPYAMASRADLDETVALVEHAGGKISAAVVDVRDSAAVDAWVADIVQTHGRVDILVANAGICTQSEVEHISNDIWHEMIDTNLAGAFYCIRAVLPTMRQAGYGRIVTISSGAGRAGMRNLGHYAATKWGLIGLTKSLALEVAAEGITANVVCPSTVNTPMVRNDSTYALFCPELENPTEEQAIPRFQSMSPMQKEWLVPEDITRAVMYLVTDRGVTSGAVIDVNLATSATRT